MRLALRQVDVRWNYVRDAADYVEQAIVDLRSFCRNNRRLALQALPLANRDRRFPSPTARGSVGSGPAVAGMSAPPSPQAQASRSVSAAGSVAVSPDGSFAWAPVSLLTGRIQITVIGARNLPQVKIAVEAAAVPLPEFPLTLMGS